MRGDAIAPVEPYDSELKVPVEPLYLATVTGGRLLRLTGPSDANMHEARLAGQLVHPEAARPQA